MWSTIRCDSPLFQPNWERGWFYPAYITSSWSTQSWRWKRSVTMLLIVRPLCMKVDLLYETDHFNMAYRVFLCLSGFCCVFLRLWCLVCSHGAPLSHIAFHKPNWSLIIKLTSDTFIHHVGQDKCMLIDSLNQISWWQLILQLHFSQIQYNVVFNHRKLLWKTLISVYFRTDESFVVDVFQIINH